MQPCKFATADAFVTLANHVKVQLRKGQAWHVDADVVRQHPGMFSDEPEVLGAPLVERATSVPGERRRVGRGAA